MWSSRNRIGIVAALLSLMVGGVATTVPAGAGSATDTTITVTKVVDGTATGPFTVVVSGCDNFDAPIAATLTFDETGAPTRTDNDLWVIDGGRWVWDGLFTNRPVACSATETDPDGATSTAWTCDYSIEQATVDPPGCATATGEGTGPADFTLIGAGEGGVGQVVDLVFTNTIAPPEPVVAEVNFTG